MDLTDRQKTLLGITEQDVLKIPIPKAPKTVSAAFIPPSWYGKLSYALTVSEKRGAMIFGPRGSGKSTAIRELARANGMGHIPMQCGQGEQLDAFMGVWTVQGGSTVYVDGPLTRAVRLGMWLLAEEANVIAPGVWSKANTLLDNTGDPLHLPTGEDVPVHPDFRCVLLYNEGYDGTKEVNGALKDRLIPIHATYPVAVVEREILHGKQPGLTMQQVDRMIDCANMIRSANLRFDLSVRALSDWGGFYLHGLGTWTECYESAVMDLMGTPDLKAPGRAVLAEIARNCGMDKW